MEGASPIALFYSRLHDRVRQELDSISDHVRRIDTFGVSPSELEAIHRKLKFLNQVYSYHSVAEDEIVYPALDAKVKNVTLPYRVEHADEGHLFVQLMQLLRCLPSPTNDPASIRALGCKVEEVSTTVRKHLAKEEEQLFPLLLEHFSYTEQASMIAQFLCCVPMISVRSFLEWMQPEVQKEETTALVHYMQKAISDDPLLTLLTSWLDPKATNGSSRESVSSSRIAIGCHRAPLRQIADVHRSIDHSMNGFIQEAKQLLDDNFPGDELSSLLDQHRFIKDVCRFHTLSEEEVMFPELIKRCQPSLDAYEMCKAEHMDEGDRFDRLGRLLMDVRSAVRQRRKEARVLMETVIDYAEEMRENLGIHMTKEEKEIFPVLEQLAFGEQCMILWRTLKMMPLRLLERVMPWIARKMRDLPPI